MWGGQGEVLDIQLLKKLIKTHGIKRYEFTDSIGKVEAIKWIGHKVFDCSGLIVWALGNHLDKDYTARGLYGLCKKIKKTDLQDGDLVFNRNLTHVGVYGKGKVIESRGTRYGVVQSGLERFSRYGRLPFVDYSPVKEFQRLTGLVEDGIIGVRTTAKVLEQIIEIKKLTDYLKGEKTWN